MGIIALITNALKVASSWFTYSTQRDAEKNSPAMQQAAAAKQLQAQEDQAAKDVATGNLDAIRKDDSAN